MIPTILALFISLLPMQQTPAALPREGSKQVIDNDRVTVWDVTWEKGKPSGIRRYGNDVVVVDLADAATRMTRDNITDIKTSVKGGVSFIEEGVVSSEEGVTPAARHAIMIELKRVTVPPLRNKSSYPDAFPRTGARKLIDNERVTVWDFTWTPGRPTAMHFHQNDVLVVYLGDGELESTTPDGKKTVSASSFGQTKFNPRDRTHSELLVKGSQRVIAVELK